MPLLVIEARFDEIGPIPRLCFGTNTLLREYQSDLDDTLDKLSWPTSCRDNLALDDKMFTLRRSTIDVDTVSVDMQLITPFIASKVARWMRTLKRHELVRLFKRYHALPSTRKMSGDVFEAYLHLIFSTEIKFDFVLMVCTRVREKRIPWWYSSHAELRESSQSRAREVLRASTLAGKTSLDMKPSLVVYYDSHEIVTGLIEADVYYIPLKTSQAGIDSFILHNGILYLLRMTVADIHDISNDL